MGHRPPRATAAGRSPHPQFLPHFFARRQARPPERSGATGPRERRRRGFGGAKPPGRYWSGRRGSNPRPTAWKAVTLPLSYSRLRAARCASRHYGGQASSRAVGLRRTREGYFPAARRQPQPQPPVDADWLPALAREQERTLVAREGFEPSKPLGRQIYSLLRLTASLPRRTRPAPRAYMRRPAPPAQ